jgi:hypothetical protein
MRHSSSLSTVESRIRRSSSVALALSGVIAASASASTGVRANTHGRLIARHLAAPTTSLKTRFARVAPARSFLLVVTEPAREPLHLTWSIRCFGNSRRESGGATGAATVASGHWVKRVPAIWIKHPTDCAGTVSGTAAASSVLIRVFAR